MTKQLTRREVLTAMAGGAVLAGCGVEQRRMPSAPVSIVKVPAYDQSVYDTMRRMLQEHLGDVRGRNIVLKPNLVEFEPGTCINTHPMVVHAALRGIPRARRRHRADCRGSRTSAQHARSGRSGRLFPDRSEIRRELHRSESGRSHARSSQRPVLAHQEALPAQQALRADLLVSIAKMKTHHWAGATLSMKNLFGVVPSGIYGWPKNVLHWAGIDESIADLHNAFPNHFAIVDGIVGMEGNGPIQGTPEARRAYWWRAGTRWRWMPPAAAS